MVSNQKLDGFQHVVGGKATAIAIACHIGKMEQISRVFAGIKEQFGRLDILVNNVLFLFANETKAADQGDGCLLFTLLPQVARQSNQAH